MTSAEEIKRVYREELNKLVQKYNLDAQDADRVCRAFNYMYDNNCSGIKESEIYKRLRNE